MVSSTNVTDLVDRLLQDGIDYHELVAFLRFSYFREYVHVESPARFLSGY